MRADKDYEYYVKLALVEKKMFIFYKYAHWYIHIGIYKVFIFFLKNG